MEQRPEHFPDWATDDVVDPVSQQNNAVQPPSSKRERGFDRSEIPPRQWHNWQFRTIGRWLRAIVGELDDLEDAQPKLIGVQPLPPAFPLDDFGNRIFLTQFSKGRVAVYDNNERLRLYRLGGSGWESVGDLAEDIGTNGDSQDAVFVEEGVLAIVSSSDRDLRTYEYDEGEGTWSSTGEVAEDVVGSNPSTLSLEPLNNNGEFVIGSGQFGILRAYAWDTNARSWSQISPGNDYSVPDSMFKAVVMDTNLVVTLGTTSDGVILTTVQWDPEEQEFVTEQEQEIPESIVGEGGGLTILPVTRDTILLLRAGGDDAGFTALRYDRYEQQWTQIGYTWPAPSALPGTVPRIARIDDGLIAFMEGFDDSLFAGRLHYRSGGPLPGSPLPMSRASFNEDDL